MPITAVVPVHNAEATLARCLDSIVHQTTPPDRIILVDDKSSDRSVELATQLGLENLQVVSLVENVGPGAARNAGAARATTEWLAFLDADDYWMPTFLEEVGAAIAQYGADFGSSGGIRELDYHDSPTRSVRVIAGGPKALDLTTDFWHVALRFMPIHPSSAVIRRDLFKTVGGFCERVRNGEDISLWASLWLNGRFAFVNKPLFMSIAPPTGLSAGPLRYPDVRIPLGLVGRSLWRAIWARKRGTGWFAVWFAGAFVRRHATWLVRRLRRGRSAVRSGRLASPRS